ncbi:MAG: hypothetical protein UU12_C0002G0025 [Candidatus Woesebacteria bacterium GW2011_GWA2_40_7b]|uniref:Uncharacterized protein n=1 Tax=Candidatus Woesebacteria bacterium GW2011_GWA2_40_7b TaxID=1618563 RepID=A0A0G0W813_9BACT|nr:MAG: hypothetical protein UU12_C0002G0025 [Candidatus Woesebacteria bacterium GW2011_GWA2_40_7b]
MGYHKYMADDSHKMLQMVLDGQSAIRGDIKNLDKKLSTKIDDVDEKLTKRIDKLGLQIANLEDDAPTIEEFDKLGRRVKKVELKIASI